MEEKPVSISLSSHTSCVLVFPCQHHKLGFLGWVGIRVCNAGQPQPAPLGAVDSVFGERARKWCLACLHRASVRVARRPGSRIPGRRNRRFWSRSRHCFGPDFAFGWEPVGRNLEPCESECGRNFSGRDPETGRVSEVCWKKTDLPKMWTFSPFFLKIDGNDGGRPKFGGPLSAWRQIDGPIPGACSRRMLRFWKIRGVGVIGLQPEPSSIVYKLDFIAVRPGIQMVVADIDASFQK